MGQSGPSKIPGQKRPFESQWVVALRRACAWNPTRKLDARDCISERLVTPLEKRPFDATLAAISIGIIARYVRSTDAAGQRWSQLGNKELFCSLSWDQQIDHPVICAIAGLRMRGGARCPECQGSGADLGSKSIRRGAFNDEEICTEAQTHHG